MKTVNKSVLIWYSAQEMFSLVTDVESYPQFLPWCDHAAVLETFDEGMLAEIGIAFGGVHQRFVTRNIHVPGRAVSLALEEGPFSRLHGDWKFHPLGEDERACKVELELQYGFGSAALGAVVGPVFDRIAGSLMEAFVKRAEQIYG